MIRVASLAAFVLLLGCGSRAPAATHDYRRLTRNDFCLSLPVYAQTDEGHFIGILQGEALLPDGGKLVRAIDLEVKVDGRDRSVWRRESEVLNWFVRVDEPLLKGCHWIEYPKRYEPGHLEIPLDRRLWLRRGGGWSTSVSLFAKRYSI